AACQLGRRVDSRTERRVQERVHAGRLPAQGHRVAQALRPRLDRTWEDLMNYVVVVLEPVPQDLGVVARSVSERFKIPVDKARALLHRAPGAVTKAVPEEQAKTVAEILSEAGLSVEVREGTAAGPPLPLFAAAPVSPSWPSAGVDEAYDEAY